MRITLALIALALSGGAARAEWETASVGGDDGAPFKTRCPQYSNLVGIEIYSRDDIDALRPICASATGPASLLESAPSGDPVGGAAQGANFTRLTCPAEKPVVVGAWVMSEDAVTSGVNTVRLRCGIAGVNEAGSAVDGPAFEAPAFLGSGGQGDLLGESFHGQTEGVSGCPKNLVAVGLHGSASGWIHALGFICGEPGLTAVKVGRFKPLNPVGKTAAKRLSGFAATIACEKYAHAGVGAALEARDLGCGFGGGRWTTDYNAHFDWCMGHGGDQTVPNEETSARAEALAQCREAKQ